GCFDGRVHHPRDVGSGDHEAGRQCHVVGTSNFAESPASAAPARSTGGSSRLCPKQAASGASSTNSRHRTDGSDASPPDRTAYVCTSVRAAVTSKLKGAGTG